MLEQLKSGFKRTINGIKYGPKLTVEQQNRYLDFLINPSFPGVLLFVLSFQNNDGRTSYTRYYPLVEIKNYNVGIYGRNVFDQPVENSFITYDNIQKIATGQGDDYTTCCLLDYNYFNNYNKQQALDVDLKGIKQINFTANLDQDGNTTMFFIIEQTKETILGFSRGTVKVLKCYFVLT